MNPDSRPLCAYRLDYKYVIDMADGKIVRSPLLGQFFHFLAFRGRKIHFYRPKWGKHFMQEKE